MDEFPNPEEEYEMLHMEEMEVMAELEREVLLSQPSSTKRKSKNCLNFDAIFSEEINIDVDAAKCNQFKETNTSSNKLTNYSSKKRNRSMDSLIDVSDLEIVQEPLMKKSKSSPSDSDLVKEFGSTSFSIPKWPFVKISTSDGERLYVKLKNEKVENDIESFVQKKNMCKSSLLETPYKTLRTLIEESAAAKLIYNSEQISALSIDSEEEQAEHLWVEQFKPNTYFDLLSDEAVNRTLLNWLKMWDKVVFNKPPKEKLFNNVSFNENSLKNDLVKALDSDGRPHYKIALLCGPPGLGKTTLAHIAAKMAGYNVIEINASDDRSIDVLSLKLDNATQMQSVLGNCQPNCLVLDEIDGAPVQTIEFLLKFINGKCAEKGKKTKKENPVKVIKRPIICICNELYAPSLRSMRHQSFVVHFPNTSSIKLAHRLMEICKKQNIKTDVGALTLLCDKTQNDIRSCISTLHFFKNKNDQRLKSTDVLNSSLGMKDVQKSIFNIWKEIFQNPIKKAGLFLRALNKTATEEVSSWATYSQKAMNKLQSIVQICQAAGEYDRLCDGVYENYLRSKFIGGNETIKEGLEWFCWFDLLDTTIKKTQSYYLMSYLPYSFAMWQILFSSNSFWKINYPSATYENYVKEMKCNQILNDVFNGLNTDIKTYNQKQNLLFDTLPLMDAILKPSLRPVNPTLFNEGEKKDFKHLIEIMVDFNLNYIQQRSADGNYSYQLDPNLDELIKFDANKMNNSRSYSYNLKQIISHELELEKMRKSERNEKNEKEDALVAKKVKTKEPFNLVPQKLNSLSFKEIEVRETGHYRDFFGRIVPRKETTSSEQGSTDKNNVVKSPIWFSFKEGFNNAVKKDITIADLM